MACRAPLPATVPARIHWRRRSTVVPGDVGDDPSGSNVICSRMPPSSCTCRGASVRSDSARRSRCGRAGQRVHSRDWRIGLPTSDVRIAASRSASRTSSLRKADRLQAHAQSGSPPSWLRRVRCEATATASADSAGAPDDAAVGGIDHRRMRLPVRADSGQKIGEQRVARKQRRSFKSWNSGCH
jgi:hypothetical protein